MKKLLFAIAAAALAYHVGAGDLTGKIVRSIEPDDRTGSSLAVVVDDVALIHTAQVIAAGQGGAQKQAEEVLSKLDSVLKAANGSLDRASS